MVETYSFAVDTYETNSPKFLSFIMDLLSIAIYSVTRAMTRLYNAISIQRPSLFQSLKSETTIINIHHYYSTNLANAFKKCDVYGREDCGCLVIHMSHSTKQRVTQHSSSVMTNKRLDITVIYWFSHFRFQYQFSGRVHDLWPACFMLSVSTKD